MQFRLVANDLETAESALTERAKVAFPRKAPGEPTRQKT